MENLSKARAAMSALAIIQVLTGCVSPVTTTSLQPDRVHAVSFAYFQSGTGTTTRYTLCAEPNCPRPSLKHAVIDRTDVIPPHRNAVNLPTISGDTDLVSMPPRRTASLSAPAQAQTSHPLQPRNQQRRLVHHSKRKVRRCHSPTQGLRPHGSPAVTDRSRPVFADQAKPAEAPAQAPLPIDPSLKGSTK